MVNMRFITLYNNQKKREDHWCYVMYFDVLITNMTSLLLCDPPFFCNTSFFKMVVAFVNKGGNDFDIRQKFGCTVIGIQNGQSMQLPVMYWTFVCLTD